MTAPHHVHIQISGNQGPDTSEQFAGVPKECGLTSKCGDPYSLPLSG